MLQAGANLLLLAVTQVIGTSPEKVVIEIKLLEDHLGVEDILLVNVDVDHLVAITRVTRHIILYRVDLVINEMLLSSNIASKTPDTVIEGEDI